MSVQTNYSDNIPVGYAGAIANEEPRTLISRTVEDAAGIGFGIAVSQGTNDKGCVASADSDVPPDFLGVTVRDQSVNPDTPSKFAQNEEARIMTQGVIWVANVGGVIAGAAVHVNGTGTLGSSGGVAIPGARWETTAANGELAQLRLA